MKIRLVARPAFESRLANPYTSLLYDHLSGLDVSVAEYSTRNIVEHSYDILHIHWPESTLNYPRPIVAIIRTIEFLLMVALAKLKGAKVIWTAHNLSSHDKRFNGQEDLFWRVFLRMIDGYISLSHSARDMLLKRHPELSKRPGFVIPHGHYRDVYQNDLSRDQARARLGIGTEERVIVFIGQVRPYKGIDQLLTAFRAMGEAGVKLVVAGRCTDTALAERLRSYEQEDPRARFFLSQDFVPSEDIQVYLNASDLVVLPYTQILNSGSALLALSFDRPILVPNHGSLPELEQEVGSDWVRMFSGNLSHEALSDALEWACAHRASRPPLHLFNWDSLAAETYKAYSSISRIGSIREEEGSRACMK